LGNFGKFGQQHPSQSLAESNREDFLCQKGFWEVEEKDGDK